MTGTKGWSAAWPLYAAVVFIFLGAAWQPIFLAVAIFLLGAAEARRDKIAGTVIAASGLAFALLVLGYGFGKGVALREDVHEQAEVPGRAP